MLKVAISFILYDKAKSIGALLGIVISTFLIGQQSGIFRFLTDAMSALVDNTKVDLWVVDNRTTDVNALAVFDIRKIREIESLEGVSKVYPVVIAAGSARLFNGKSAGVLLIGSEAPTLKAGPWNVIEGNKFELLQPDAVSMDLYDRQALGGAEVGTALEISGKRAQFFVKTKGARGFGALYMFTTLERARYYGNVPRTKVSALLIDVYPHTDVASVRDRINSTIYGVRAWQPADFSLSTKKTVLSQTGIGVSTGTLILFAIISGFFIIGLTLYSSAIDRLRDYGTMKAIGANNTYITKLILLQALIFAICGFVIGYACIEAFRIGIGKAGAIFNFSWPIRLVFFSITLLISLGGAVFAIRRIARVEPALVFRG